MLSIAFIGLGTLGLPMALNLLKAGYPVTVYNRTRSREEAAVDQGAIAAASPQAAAAQADVIITCVSDSPDVEAVILGENGVIFGAKPGSIVVDMSTISPQVTRNIGQRLAAQGVSLLDAPVSGGLEGAQQGTLSIMVGGEPEALERVQPILQVLGSRVTHLGPLGSGQLTKAINQIIIAGTYWGIAEGLTLGLKAGLDLDQVVQAVGGGAAGSWGLSHRSGHMIHNHYPLGFRLRLHRKDLQIALEAARQLGMPLPVAAYVEQMETGLIHQGYGDEDVSAVARSVRQQAGLSDADAS